MRVGLLEILSMQDALREVGLVEAWLIWMECRTENLTLYWQTMLFWGRFGKVIQFVGALLVAVEIIGPERLRRFAASLKGAGLPARLRKQVLIEEEGDAAKGKGNGDHDTASMIIIMIIATFFAFPAAGTFVGGDGWPFVVAAFVFMLLFMLLGVFLVWLAAWLLERSISALAWVLEHPRLDRLMKLLSVALVVVGFHFDLLAS
jgi:hypothetical protein